MDAQAVKKATKKDPVLSKVLHYTRRGWPEEVPNALKQYASKRMELSIEDERLLLGMQVIILKTLQAAILKELHNNHPGIARMKGLARGHVWWPNLVKEIEILAKCCQPCQSVKQAPRSAPLNPLSWPTKP